MSKSSGSTNWLAARVLQTGKGLRGIALLSLLLGMFGPLMGVTPTLADTTVTTTGSGQQYTVVKQSTPTYVAGTTAPTPSSDCDDCNVTVKLPFAYTFYGTTHTAGSNVQLSSNGVLAFGSALESKYTNTVLPANGFTDAIFGYWSDLRTDVGNGGISTSVSGTAPNRIWNVDWTTAVYSNNSNKVYFEIRLYEGQQRFDIEYGNKVDPNGNPATVGVQQGAGSNWTQQEFDTASSVQPNTGYTYTYAGDNTAPISSASAMLAGTSPAVSYTSGAWTNNTAGVTVNLSGSDNTGGSGVKNISYTETGAQTNTGTITGSSGSVPVTAQGSTTITYFTTDNAGNVESPSHTFVVNLDLTKPVTSASAGTYTAGSWTNAKSVSIGLSAKDDASGSGVKSITYSATGGQSIASTTTNGATATVPDITSEGTTTVSYFATDNAGNVELAKTFVVMIDRTAPVITSSRTPAAPPSGWNSTPVEVDFTCTDPKNGNSTAGSGVPSGSAPTSPQYVNSDGGNQSRTGTCTDAAGNTASTTVSNINVDQTGPQITGTIATQPSGTDASGAKWFKGDVSVTWTCTDPASTTAANSTTSGVTTCAGTNGSSGIGAINGEGSGLTTTGVSTDVAGNLTTGTSPAVNIDRHAPVTTVMAPSGWNKSAVTLTLNATDGTGSGVAHTYYTVDGSQSEGTSVSVSGDGTHTVTFWSVDYAGNTEAANSVQVKIDGTKPNITLTSPSPILPWYNASNSPVALTYSCTDATSGIATCDGVQNTTGTNNSTGSNSVGTEGKNQDIQATAVDNAGNSAIADTLLNIDLTAPLLSGAPTTQPNANANGWYNGPVTVHWSYSDPLSGIATSPNDVSLSTDGGSQSVSGTATDVAGNSTTKTVGGINIDQTAPTITGDPTTADHNGWYTGDVTIDWTCADNAPTNAVNTTTSGLAGGCPASSTITGEGNNLSASVSVSDKAGNLGTGSRSVQIDRTAPVTTASYADANTSGWYSGAVTVTLTGKDGLSGIDPTKDGSDTFYTVDGGATQTYTGPFQVDGSAVHHVTFWSVDVAGNVEAHDPTANPGNTIALQIDETPPTITPSRTGTDYANAHSGWNNTDVTVSFNCQDTPSGVASCTNPVTLNTDGAGTDGSGQSVTGTAVDLAGNSTTATQGGIKIDETKPVMTVASVKTADGHDYTLGSWTNQAVTVTFACTDATSGVASFTDPVTVSAEGPSQGAKGTCADAAGNVAETSVDNINIDTTPPAITTGRTPAANGNGWNNSDVSVTFDCNDPNNASNGTTGSGVANQPVSPQIVKTDGANQSKTGTCTDAAGNTTTATVGNINVDETNPTLSGVPTTLPNGNNGWYTSPVTIAWTCSDATSGIDGTLSIPAPPSGSTTGCPGNSTVTNDGAAVTTSASVTDKAGNQVTWASQAVKLDQKAPVTSADAPQGWVQSDTLHLTPQDDTSGVAATNYSVDSGSWQTSTTFPVSITLTTTGTHTVAFWSEDVAGNKESQQSVQIKVDASAPDVKPSQSPDANTNGWNKSSVTVTYTCSDADSGIKTCAAGFGTTTNTSTSDNTTTSNTTPSIHSSVGVTSQGKDQKTTGTGTDVVGNQATSQYLVNIDETAPLLSGAPTTKPNTNGWYNSPVTVHWTYSDGLSGIFSAPADATLSSDGGNQSVSGTAADAAGNSTTTPVGGINIDQTAPTITGAATTPPNGNGWYKGDVTIHWTCADSPPATAANSTTSGVATCPKDSTITGEGSNLGDSESGTDNAGNTGTGTVTGINIDRTAPNTTASYAPANANGWYKAPVAVTLNATDNKDGSGVDTTYYTVDGVGPQTYSGPFQVSGDKVHTVNYWSVDKAGNVEDKTAAGNTIQLSIDSTAPTITGTASPAPNGAGWNNTNVVVSFTCGDALSGVSNCTANQTVSTESANQSVTGTATDLAGNTNSFTVTNINIDKTAPVVTYTGNAGTYNLTQTVTITCTDSDTLSGVASNTCQNVNAPAYTFAIGANTLSATAIDKAGNPGSGSTSFKVTTNFSDLCALTQQFMNPDPNEANSLCVKLTNAQADAAKGNTNAKSNLLSAYKNELNAQSGKDFTAAQVSILTKWASTL